MIGYKATAATSGLSSSRMRTRRFLFLFSLFTTTFINMQKRKLSFPSIFHNSVPSNHLTQSIPPPPKKKKKKSFHTTFH